MKVSHVIHHVLRRALNTSRIKFQFDFSEKRHCYYACEQVAPNLAIRPMSDRTHRHEIIILTESESVLYLPTIKAGLHNLGCRPIRIVGDDYILPKWKKIRVRKRLGSSL